MTEYNIKKRAKFWLAFAFFWGSLIVMIGALGWFPAISIFAYGSGVWLGSKWRLEHESKG